MDFVCEICGCKYLQKKSLLRHTREKPESKYIILIHAGIYFICSK